MSVKYPEIDLPDQVYPFISGGLVDKFDITEFEKSQAPPGENNNR